MTARTTTWRNWSRLVEAHPITVVRPSDPGEVIDAVLGARAAGVGVRAVGSGHSFTPVAATDGIQLDLERMRGITAIDAERKHVTLRAGTRLHEVPELLRQYGLAMANLGDIDRQTIAGALSTGTHGTGLDFPGLAGTVVGVGMVTGTGELVHYGRHDDLLPAAALSLGSLGVLVDVTIACVDAFDLHAVEQAEPLDDVLDDLLERWRREDHFEFHWFPYSDLASTKRNTRVPVGSGTPRGRLSRWIGEEVVGNAAFGALLGIERAIPPLTGPANRFAAKHMADAEYTEDSHGVFTAPRRVRFREMEYALPLDEVPDAVRAVRELVHAHPEWRIRFPIEVRSAGADDRWLSTAHGRDTGYIAVHQWFKSDHAAFFAAAEDLFVARGGRPHWGKLHTRDAAYFAGVYPRFAEFQTLRRELDPSGVFATPHFDRILGPLPR